MNVSHWHAAARNGLTALLVAETLAVPVAWADGPGNLVLPLVRAMALAVAATEATHTPGDVHVAGTGHATVLRTTPPPRRPGLIPRQLVIPDGYALDVERTPPSFAEPIDTDRVVGFELLRRRRWGWMPSIGYDSDGSRRVPGSRAVVRVELDFEF